MSQDLRRIILEAVVSGLVDRIACLISQAGQKFEFHAGDSRPETEYDLASLTKIICTTRLSAQALVSHKLSLQESPWPNWPGVTIMHVLAHTSGLPAWTAIQNISEVLAVKPVFKAGETTLYSDIGFMALGALLEERLGAPLDVLFHKPRLHFKGSEPADDANCRALGGVAGHAGLFGTLDAVCQEGLFFLKCLKKPESELEKAIQKFAVYPGPRGLGFDRPSHGGSTGEALSAQAVGHLGFTGTSLWVDPVTDSVYVLLAHRFGDMLALRRAFHQNASARENAFSKTADKASSSGLEKADKT